MRLGDKTIDESRQGEALVLDGNSKGKKLFLESYGCAMNFSDSEIIASILAEDGYSTTREEKDADLILINTCSIREKAELTIRKRLEKYNSVKREKNPKMKVGVLGCMAERLKTKFLEEEKIVELNMEPTISSIEQIELNDKLSKHGQNMSEPATLILPFLIYNLEGSDRDEFTIDMPWILKRFIVPVIWKSKWSKMKPFLLT